MGAQTGREQSVDQHFSLYFIRGPVLPIQMTVGKGLSEEGMKGNLVVLKKKVKVDVGRPTHNNIEVRKSAFGSTFLLLQVN